MARARAREVGQQDPQPAAQRTAEPAAPVAAADASPNAAPEPAAAAEPSFEAQMIRALSVPSGRVTAEDATPRASAPAARGTASSQRVEPKLAALDVEGSLGHGVVSRMLSRALPHLRRCYAEVTQRAGQDGLAPLPVTLKIDEAGAVRDVHTGAHPLASCTSGVMRRLRSDIKPDIGLVRVRFDIQFLPL
jgi:hypothetical protein